MQLRVSVYTALHAMAVAQSGISHRSSANRMPRSYMTLILIPDIIYIATEAIKGRSIYMKRDGWFHAIVLKYCVPQVFYTEND